MRTRNVRTPPALPKRRVRCPHRQSQIALPGDTTRLEEAIRRATEIAIAALCLLIMLPLMMSISICIKFDSPGPVLSKKKRLGANNVPFSSLKFRSMYVEQARPLGRQLTGAGDPRITRVGTLLRRTSMDELPQLINVLRGEISLGPLAPPPSSAADASANSETPILRRLRRLRTISLTFLR